MPDDVRRRLLIAPANFLSPFCAAAHGRGCWDCIRKITVLVAISAVAAACTLPPTGGANGQPQEFDLTCSAHWARENPAPWQPANVPEQHYHIDLSQGLVNYKVPLSATPIQLTWTADHDGYMYHITINRLTGALYDMQLFPSGLRTGYDISGTCELAPPPRPQPKF